MNKSSKKLLIAILGLLQGVPVINSMELKKPIVGKHPRSKSPVEGDSERNKKKKVENITFDFRGPGLSEGCTHYADYTEKNLKAGDIKGDAQLFLHVQECNRMYKEIYEYGQFDIGKVDMEDELLEKLKTVYSQWKAEGHGDYAVCYYVNHKALIEGQRLSGDLDTNQEYKFITLLFNRVWKHKNKSKEIYENQDIPKYLRIEITDFGDNSMDVNKEKLTDPYMRFENRVGDGVFLSAQVFSKETLKLKRGMNIYEVPVVCQAYTIARVNDELNNLTNNDKNLVVRLLNKLVNKKFKPEYVGIGDYNAIRKANTVKISLNNFVEDQTELNQYQQLSPKCKRLILHILGELVVMSINMKDGGMSALGVVRRELSKIDSSVTRNEDKYDVILEKIKN